MKNKLYVHPLFIILGVIMLALGEGLTFVFYIVTLLLHELGHSTVARRLGYKLNNFCLLPQGAVVSGNQQFFNYNDEVKIALAGPLVNVSLALICVAIWWLAPELYGISETFVMCNISTAIVNLLPVLPLDGGRVMVALFSKIKKRSLGIKLCNIFGYTLAGFFCVLFILSLFYLVNFTFLIFAIFIVVGIVSSGGDNMYITAFSKSVKQKGLARGINVKSVVVSETSTLASVLPLISGHNYYIVYVANEYLDIVATLHENDITELCSKHDLNTKICEVV